VFGIALHQRRRLVLHASAVSVNGRGVLFCGPSGAGKSTLAAALIKEGYRFVTDDVCLIDFGAASEPYVVPDGRMLKLWEDALGQLALDERKEAAVRDGIRKYYVPTEEPQTVAPLYAIYVLREARPPLVPGIEPINTADALVLMKQHAYRPLLAEKMGLSQPYFFAASKVLRQARMFYLTRCLDFGATAQVIESLRTHWREMGIAS
jgi:hypothetical protein